MKWKEICQSIDSILDFLLCNFIITFHDAQNNVHNIGADHAVGMIIIFECLIEEWEFGEFFIIKQTQLFTI